MNMHTTTGQARSQPRDMAVVRPANRFTVGGTLAELEYQRDSQAKAEVDWLLKQHGVTLPARTSLVSMLRQAIGVALVHAGERLASVPQTGVSPETASVASMPGTAG